MRGGAQPSAKKNSEATPHFSVPSFRNGPETNVVDSQRGVIFRATFKSDFELPTKILVELISDQVAKQAFCIRPHVERFCCGRTGTIASRNVPDSVSTSFASCNSAVCKKTKQCWSLVQADIVDLRILPRCEVNEATAKT